MKTITVYACLVIALLLPNIGKAVEGYKLVCDDPVYNFGTVDQTAVITNIFLIRNEGDLTYVHKYVHTSCSCTKGQVEKKMLGPGETMKVTVVFKADNRKGKQRKSVRLIPMHADKPALTLYMTGIVNVP